jgi:hypothetical protein
MPTQHARFRILIADLDGDAAELTQTRHLEMALADQMGIAMAPVGPGPVVGDGLVEDQALDPARTLLASHNGDALIFGEVIPAANLVRIRLVGRYDGAAGRHGPYQTGWSALPRRFGLDYEGQLLALVALAIAPNVRSREDRAHLINLLRPAATKLTRLLEHPTARLDADRQGALWHALGLAASLLGETTKSRRWLEVALHAYRAALQIWQADSVLQDWAIAQNNLGHALHMLALEVGDPAEETAYFGQAINAYHRALHVYKAAEAKSYLAQTEANLARTESSLAERAGARPAKRRGVPGQGGLKPPVNGAGRLDQPTVAAE